jgi:predicted DNA-binding WGR domain protein
MMMKYIAQIQQDFVRIAREWDDLTREEQQGYLQRHPKTKRRLTGQPQRIAPASGLKIVEPQRHQSREILDLMRSRTNAASDVPEWRNYITMRSEDGAHNKYHYFAVMHDKNNQYAAANVYGRIGYPPKGIMVLGHYPTKNEAQRVAETKLNAKMKKGYVPTSI